MARKKKHKKSKREQKRLIKDIKKLAVLIERIDTPLKIIHAQVAVPQQSKPDKRA